MTMAPRTREAHCHIMCKIEDVAWQGWPVACASHHPACLVWTYCTARSGAIRNVATSSALQLDTEKHAPSPAGQFRAPQQDNSPMRRARSGVPGADTALPGAARCKKRHRQARCNWVKKNTRHGDRAKSALPRRSSLLCDASDSAIPPANQW